MLSNDLMKAFKVAIKAHHGVMDKSREPYILHPITVANSIGMPDGDLKVIALLHDVVEDSDVTLQDLEDEGFNENVVEAVDALTRRIEESYFQYIDRVKKNPFAVVVKKADLKHNMSRNRNFKISDNLRKKYEKAEAILSED